MPKTIITQITDAGKTYHVADRCAKVLSALKLKRVAQHNYVTRRAGGVKALFAGANRKC